MDPNQAPQAPPPFVPSPGQSNPYDFLQDPVKGKKSLLPQNTSQKQRLLIAVGGVVVLLLIGSLVMALLSSLNSGPKDTYLGLEQQQVEMIRVAGLGSQGATQPEAKALAITVKYSLLSQQATVQKLAKQAHAPTDSKSLNASKNTKTDATLTTASQTNQFDQTFIALMKADLASYRKTLDQARVNTKSAKSQATLKAYESQIDILLADDKNSQAATN